MRSDNPGGADSLSLSVAQRIDEVCSRFEAAWQAGREPSIEDYLGDTQGAERETLLWELLRIEIDHRLLQGSVPTVEEYRSRFPVPEPLLREEIEARIALATGRSQSNETVATQHDGTGVRTGPPVNEPTPEIVVPGYEVRGPLGEGGMARVYRAHDADFDRSLAIKVMKAELAHHPEAETRFLAEARITGRLQHPGIPPVHEIGRLADGRPFLAMKLIEGQTLHDLLKRRSTPASEWPRFVAIFGQVCQTTGYAHSQGVIHRDLKPQNVMVGAFGEVQVMDWGLARERGCREAPAVLGTPAFMAPEQARGESDLIDERADVFGLGAVLCVILTGEPPFVGTDVRVVLGQAVLGNVGDAFVRLDDCGADAELIALAKWCLAADREQRPRDAGAVAAAVQAYQTGVEERARKAEVERAGAQARAEEATKKARAERRARRLTLGLAAALLLVVIGGGIGVWLIQQQRAATAQGIRTTMDQGRTLLKEGWEQNSPAKLIEAKDAAERALGVARGSNASADLRHEAEALRDEIAEKITATATNNALLAALLDVSEPRETDRYTKTESGQMMAVAEIPVETQFANAFGRWGLNLDGDSLEDVVARLGAQPEPVIQEVVNGLDAWALDRRRKGKPEARWRRLIDVAERLDEDAGRKKLRDLLASNPLERTKANAAAWDQAQTRLLEETKKVDAEAEPVRSLLARVRVLQAFSAVATAEALLRSSLARHPNEVGLLATLSTLLENQKPSRLAEAIGCHRAVRSVRPQLGITLGRMLIKANQAPEGEAVFRDLERLQLVTPDLYFYLGNALSAQKKLREAEAAYRRALELKPDYADAYNNLGVALHHQQKLAEAVTAYRRAIELKPDLVQAHNNLGNALGAQKKLGEAVAALRTAIELQPDLAEAYYNLGIHLREQKKLKEAVAAFRKAIALKPDYADAYNNLGNALKTQKKLAEAVVAYRKAIALKPDDAVVYNNLGVALAEQKKLEEAVAAFRKAIALKPDYANAYNNLGLALSDQKKVEEAMTAYRRAIELEPDLAEAYCNLGSALSDQKKLGEAVASFRRAIQIQPDHARAYNNLGNALQEQKKLGEAVSAYRKADQLLSNHPGIRKNLRHAELWLELESKLRLIQAKKEHPRSAQEGVELARFCLNYKEHYAAAVGFFSEAFIADPKLAGDLQAQHRYLAASAALLAAAGKGQDARGIDAEQRGKFRQQALQWLHADLDAYAKLAAKEDKELRQALRQRLSIWMQDDDLATVRDAKELAALPELERKTWQKPWEDVAALRKKCQ